MIDKTQLAELAEKSFSDNKRLVKRLSLGNGKKLNELVHRLHQQFFEEMDCLTCGNCCASISPILNKNDIEKLTRSCGMKSTPFEEKYITIDADDDFVFKTSPCPFLDSDNSCMQYEARPRSCKEYPHTDHHDFQKILQISLKNTFICPVVYQIFEELKLAKI